VLYHHIVGHEGQILLYKINIFRLSNLRQDIIIECTMVIVQTTKRESMVDMVETGIVSPAKAVFMLALYPALMGFESLVGDIALEDDNVEVGSHLSRLGLRHRGLGEVLLRAAPKSKTTASYSRE